MAVWTVAPGPFLAVSAAQENSSPFGLPPPFVPKTEAPANKNETPATKSEAPAKKAETVDKSELPPEEDKSEAPKEFSFNPVQSQKQILAGDYYFKKGNFIAAANRYDEATKWNDGNAEAWLRLGEAEEKKPNLKAARVAYQKYLEISPDAKNAAEIRKRVAKIKP